MKKEIIGLILFIPFVVCLFSGIIWSLKLMVQEKGVASLIFLIVIISTIMGLLIFSGLI